MNYKDEAIEIVKASITECPIETGKALMLSIMEFKDYSNEHELSQLIYDIYWELECPTEETGPEEPIIEVGSNGVFDS